MKRILIALTLISAGAVYADVIPALSSISLVTSGPYAGDYLWTYSVSIAADQQVQASGAAQAYPNFFNVIDFGAIPGSPAQVTAADWSGYTGAPMHGFAQNAPDDAAVADAIFEYSGPDVHGPLTVCCFGLYSTTNQEALGWYEGQGTLYSPGNPADGTIQGNVGRLIVPYGSSSGLQQIPEPSSSVLIGGGLIAASLLARRRRTA